MDYFKVISKILQFMSRIQVIYCPTQQIDSTDRDKEKIERHFMRFIIQYLTYCTLPCLFGQLTMLHNFRSFRGTVIKIPCKIILPL